MSDVNLRLSGPVNQTINPWTAYFSAMGSQIGLINVNVGTSSDPNTERDVLSSVASYGKQLGRIGDALIVLLKHIEPMHLSEHERSAMRDLRSMLDEIANVKEKHGAKLVLRPPG
jgi:hypothetical protein